MKPIEMSRTYHIRVRKKLFKSCKTVEEKDAIVKRLLLDKTLTKKDIIITMALKVKA